VLAVAAVEHLVMVRRQLLAAQVVAVLEALMDQVELLEPQIQAEAEAVLAAI
jgi:hypothetical protein